jgi:hypothetical protein
VHWSYSGYSGPLVPSGAHAEVDRSGNDYQECVHDCNACACFDASARYFDDDVWTGGRVIWVEYPVQDLHHPVVNQEVFLDDHGIIEICCPIARYCDSNVTTLLSLERRPVSKQC